MLSDNVASKKGQYFFPLLFTIFSYILMLNLIGLVPYSFTLTSHLIVTFALALFIFIGINIICVRIHG
jgi:F-type H+-transporting ATPase subunit a